jgi:hypothetical protein
VLKRNINIFLATSFVCLLGVLAVFLLGLNNDVELPGVVRASVGSAQPSGFYDMRAVVVDSAGELVFQQDFADVSVQNGQYSLPLDVPRYAPEGESVLQICRGDATEQPDGLAAPSASGCEDVTSGQQAFEVAECPQQLLIDQGGGVLGGLLGSRNVSSVAAFVTVKL